MARYFTVRLTEAQALAAINACDLIREEYDAEKQAGGAIYRRAGEAIDRQIVNARAKAK